MIAFSKAYAQKNDDPNFVGISWAELEYFFSR